MGTFITYFTDSNVPAMSSWFIAAVSLGAISLLVGLLAPLVLYVAKQRKAKWSVRYTGIISRFAGVARTIGFLELLVLFLRYEGIFPFTNRIWMVGIGLIGLGWLSIIVRQYRAFVPVLQKQDQLQDRYHKYLPKPKRRQA